MTDENRKIRVKSQSEIVEEFEREKKIIHAAWAKAVAEIDRLTRDCGGFGGEALDEGRERALKKARREYERDFYELAAAYGLFEARP